MLSSDVIRGYNDTMILFILLEGDSYGYEVSKQIRTITDDRYAIKETTLYSAFTRLEKNGFIEPYAGNETHGKPRTYYRITPSGRAFYQSKCREWTVARQVIDQFILEGFADGND